jgi:medium-chain acyl-[acyl-carrier-protein] hydrolase
VTASRESAQRWTGAGWQPGADAAHILFCLPHAGGSAAAFRPWAVGFPPEIAVCPIHLPGRGIRIREPAVIDIAAIAGAIRRLADRPYAICGHSMGAWVGHDTARLLLATGARPPDLLVVSGADPPDEPDSVAARLYGLPVDRLVSELVDLGGIDPEVLRHPDLLALVVPTIRADLRWIVERAQRRERPLDIPIIALGGTADPIVAVDRMRGWKQHTSAGFRLHELPGGHFAPYEDAARVGALITAGLSGTAAPA